MSEKKWYFFIEIDESERVYFLDGQHFLEHLQKNDPVTCGAEELTDEEAAAINGPDSESEDGKDEGSR